MLLGHQEESEWSPVVVAPYMGRIFSKKAFHGWGRGGRGDFFGQIYARQL